MPDYPDSVKLEKVQCPIGCAPSDVQVVCSGDRLHAVAGTFIVVKCQQCGLMRTNPRPTADTISAYYPGEYAPHRDAALSRRSAARSAVSELLGLAGRRSPPVPAGHLLEIGCAAGAYLETMRAEGWTVSGIEFSHGAAAWARAKKIEVQVATVESARAPDQPIDMIAAWMVLEHLHEPILALRRMRRWIKPDGYLIGSVPDAGSLERRLFGSRWYALQLPTHLFHYTARSLGRVLAESGWQLTRLSWQRNCTNLLWSLEYCANDAGMPRIGRAINWLRTSPVMGKPRALLGWLLGITRQSGRLEFWAKPLPSADDARVPRR